MEKIPTRRLGEREVSNGVMGRGAREPQVLEEARSDLLVRKELVASAWIKFLEVVLEFGAFVVAVLERQSRADRSWRRAAKDHRSRRPREGRAFWERPTPPLEHLDRGVALCRHSR